MKLTTSMINQSSQLHTTTIDGITGEANIAEHWRTHFHGILNTNICDQTLKSSILGTLDDIQHDTRMTVCYTDHWRIEGGAKGAVAPPPPVV